jgi:hypothetical protein
MKILSGKGFVAKNKNLKLIAKADYRRKREEEVVKIKR